MTTIGNIEHLVDKLCATVSSLRTERDQLRAQVDELKSNCRKDLKPRQTGRKTADARGARKGAYPQKGEEPDRRSVEGHLDRISTLMPSCRAHHPAPEERSARGTSSLRDVTIKSAGASTTSDISRRREPARVTTPWPSSPASWSTRLIRRRFFFSCVSSSAGPLRRYAPK